MVQGQLNHGISDLAIKSEALSKNRLVVRRALRSGYKALLDLGKNLTPEIKAKYDGMELGAKTVGEVGAQLLRSGRGMKSSNSAWRTTCTWWGSLLS